MSRGKHAFPTPWESAKTRRRHEIALDDGVRKRAWEELDERIRRLVRVLRRDLSIPPGGHAAFVLGNRVECLELTLAAVAAGIWITPVNRHLTQEEISYVLRDCEARAVFTDEDHREKCAGVDGIHVIDVDSELPALLQKGPAADPDFSGPPGGTMGYTSGTTGHPKGVRRKTAGSAAEALRAAAAGGAAIGLDGSGPHLVTGPLYHAAPLLFALYDHLNGAPVVILPRWEERRALRTIAERRIHHTHLVPTMFVRLLRLPEEERRAFRGPSLHLVLHGAAPIAPEVKRRMIDWWGPILVEYWGATESGVVTLVSSEDWLRRPGTVGRPTAAWEVRAVDEHGRVLGPNEVGVFYCRHRLLDRPFEYHRDPEKTAAAYGPDGSITIGDVGYVDEEGWVYLCDRRADIIISGGVNVYPAEIERVLQGHPAVADVAVVGVPDEEWGEQVKAIVEPVGEAHPGPELEREILQFARRHLAAYKVPRSVDFEPDLPRLPSGKLMKRQLRDRYWAGRDRKI